MRCILLVVPLLLLVSCVSRPIGAQSGVRASTITKSPETALDLKNLAELLDRLFPNRNYAASFGYRGLLVDLQHFDITTVEQLRAILVENLGFAEAEEAKRDALYGKPERGYYYNCVGMATLALRKHVGEDVFDEYELEGRPNQTPEPTPTAGTSAAEQPLVPAAVVAHL